MDAECALTLPISHFKKVVYYTSVIELGIASLMMSHDQSFKIYMIRMWKKLSFSRSLFVAETIRLFTLHHISISDSIVSMSMYSYSYNKLVLQMSSFNYKH